MTDTVLIVILCLFGFGDLDQTETLRLTRQNLSRPMEISEYVFTKFPKGFRTTYEYTLTDGAAAMEGVITLANLKEEKKVTETWSVLPDPNNPFRFRYVSTKTDQVIDLKTLSPGLTQTAFTQTIWRNIKLRLPDDPEVHTIRVCRLENTICIYLPEEKTLYTVVGKTNDP